MQPRSQQIAVVIPCYRVGNGILDVLSQIGTDVSQIYVVDDGCPLKTGDIVANEVADSRVTVIRHKKNLGVGAAVKTGYVEAVNNHATVIVKLDGDGQMNPNEIPRLIAPIQEGLADYTKGNRFFEARIIKKMPLLRFMGNLALTYISRLSSGNWLISDPNNGYTAITATSLQSLNLNEISDTYFFESDMIFQLSMQKKRIVDVNITAIYSTEESNLKISRSLFEFSIKHLRNFLKRILRNSNLFK